VRGIETDYLIVGAGAAGMAFVDALVAAGYADAVRWIAKLEAFTGEIPQADRTAAAGPRLGINVS
jgi:cation diffusion facilitator CzcD-associated flavoprotein CzcO